MKFILKYTENFGNKIPHPFVLFYILSFFIVLFSCLMNFFKINNINPKSGNIIILKNLFSAEGIIFILEDLIKNFIYFPPLGAIVIFMFGIGLLDKVGIINDLMKLIILKSSEKMLNISIILISIIGSVAADATYLILVPLSGKMFNSLGKNPLAGAALAYSSAGAGYNANIFITPTDILLSSISTEASRTVDPFFYVSPIDNYYFIFISTLLLVIISVLVFEKIIEPHSNFLNVIETKKYKFKSISLKNINYLKFIGLFTLLFLTLLIFFIYPDKSYFRNLKGKLIPSPFLDVIIPLLFTWFFMIGIIYGILSKKITKCNDIPKIIINSSKDLNYILVLFFSISQFIAYFKWTSLSEFIAINTSNFILDTQLSSIFLILLFIILVSLLSLFITSGSTQWSLMAPIFIPTFMFLDFDPAFIQAAYRIGDSVTNTLSPISPYFAITLSFMQKYKKNIGIGSLISLVLPMSIWYFISWTILFFIWSFFNLPIGPDVYMKLNN